MENKDLTFHPKEWVFFREYLGLYYFQRRHQDLNREDETTMNLALGLVLEK